jgi:hypothetical protein
MKSARGIPLGDFHGWDRDPMAFGWNFPRINRYLNPKLAWANGMFVAKMKHHTTQ